MVSRVAYRNVGEIRDIWGSLLDTRIYPDCHEDDKETQGMAFLSHTTLSIFKRSREKHKRLEAEVESLQQQLHVKQMECKTLQGEKELAEQKCKQLSADLNGCRLQECQSCVKLESEVGNLKSSIKVVFANLSKFAQDSNDTASDQDEHHKQAFTYMTQVLNGTQVTVPIARVTPSKKRPIEPVSPDEIPDTPEVPNRSRFSDRLKRKALGNRLHLKKPLHLPPSSEKLPAGEGASPTKSMKKTFLPSSSMNPGEDSYLVKNTEDLDETLKKKPILKENMVIESLSPECPNQEGNKCSKGGKENKNIADEAEGEKLLVNLSTDVPFPSTPERPTQITKPSSPILGSVGSKKSNSKRACRTSPHENTSPSLLGDSHTTHVSAERQVSQVALNKARFEVHIEKHGHTRKRFFQPTLTNHFQPRITDLATLHEFNGGKRSDSDLGVEVLKMSEAEQWEYALKESLKEAQQRENSSNSRQFTAPEWNLGQNKGGGVDEDDDDFILASPTATLPNVRKINQSKVPGSTIEETELEEAKSINETFFDPHLPSAQEGQSGGKPPVTKGSMETQFNPLFNSTMITGDPKQADQKQSSAKAQFISPCSSIPVSETQFNPPLASTAREMTQNSELEAMVQEIERDVNPACLQTSYDRVPSKNPPSPNYVYKRDVVRKKNEKMQLPGWDCPDCGGFYKAAGYEPNDPSLKAALNKCSRHRDKFGMRPSTPKGYWDPGFPSTQSLIGDKTFSSE